MSLQACSLDTRNRNNLKVCKTATQKIFGSFLKIVISPTGENRLNIFHPSFASRLRKIENALHQQNVEIDHEVEAEKIARLKQLLVFPGSSAQELRKSRSPGIIRTANL